MTTVGKRLYEIGEMPPLGDVPELMHASVIRRQRYGEPIDAFGMEELPVPHVGDNDVLVYVMAAGVNYNNVWAAMGHPVDVIGRRMKGGATEDFHIGGSDASGIVWAVGKNVTQVKVGDEVVLSCCMWDPNADDIRAGCDPTTSTSTRIWGYEVNYGSFAQFTRVAEYQCIPKPKHLTWEAAAA
ncbi:MAG: alcohol dehydrogenase catalytic domain-containing protein, partial [Planctomycetales bacterium]|nr:alcohol dehydrogenase catalytic domain-containing protein [Planctomycetales bacterium]